MSSEPPARHARPRSCSPLGHYHVPLIHRSTFPLEYLPALPLPPPGAPYAPFPISTSAPYAPFPISTSCSIPSFPLAHPLVPPKGICSRWHWMDSPET